jgi:hypothetical protein
VRQSTKRIEVVAKKLRNLPSVAKKPGQTPKKAVKAVQDELVALLARGYTVEEIGRVLRGAGIEISAVTLRGYARDIATAATTKRAATTERPSAAAAPAKRKVVVKRKVPARTATSAGKPAPTARKSTPPSASPKARKPAAKPPVPTTGSFHDYGKLAKASFVVRPDTPDSDL